MSEMSDNDVIDFLLSSLSRKGPARFNVYFELEERYGQSFAERKVNFFMNALEDHQLAKQDPSDMIFRLSSKGKVVLDWGGWLKFREMYRQAALRDESKRVAVEQKRREKLMRFVDSYKGKEEVVAERHTLPSVTLYEIARYILTAAIILFGLMHNDFLD